MLKRVIQLLVLVILFSVSRPTSAAPRIDACETNGPEWCCQNIYCGIAEALCTSQGGTMGCGWNSSTSLCDVTPCVAG